MKRYLSIIAATALFSLTACKKGFLDIVPKGKQVAVTTADYELLMNNSDFYFYNYAGGLREFVLMGDEIAAESSLFGKQPSPLAVRAFQWDPVIFDRTLSPLDLNVQTGAMYIYNKIINEVMASADGSEADKKGILAEAKATRAFTNFLWVNIYGKPYQSGTAVSDPAFPIITTSSISVSKFTRASVQEMYDAIIADLTDAIADLPVNNKVQTRFSRPAAQALLAKVYMFMGKYQDALPLLSQAFASVATSPFNIHLYDYNVELGPGGSFLPISSFTGPNGPGNNYNDFTESVLVKTFTGGPYDGNGFENNGLVLSPDAASLFGSSDLRLQLYTNLQPNGSPNPGGRLRKYGQTYIKFGLELSEMYLLSAECKARTGDLAGAVADVQTLREHRMPAADAAVPGSIAGDQTELTKFIIEERIREFAVEGFRWFDMRRLSVDPIFAGTVYTHTLFDPAGNTVFTLKPERLVLQIPQQYIDANPGMENNP